MRKETIVHESPKSPISESVRLLRTNLTFLAGRKKNPVVLVTSAAPGDGKSWVTANLAIAYAQANKKVLLVDSDLRKGRQHKIFEKHNTVGFSDYLQSVEEIEDDLELQAEILMKSITTTKVPNLFLITSGVVPPNPSELLDTPSFDNFLNIVKENFDVIIFDMPPVSIVADSLVICKKVDQVVLVCAVGQTKKNMLLDAKRSIQKVGGKVAGVVVNKMPSSKRKEYVKYYSHYSDQLVPIGTTTRNRKVKVEK